MPKLTTLQKFYKNQKIFLTGGTGFVGKILINKLLRSCGDISTIYVLIRPKREKSVRDRLRDMFNDPVFNLLKKEVPHFSEKIVAVPGDCTHPNLGLSNLDYEMLTDNVSIVFNAAANVKFNEKLTVAAETNFRSTAKMVDLCKNITKLQSFINITTGYSNICLTSTVQEKFYDYPIKSNDFMKLLNTLPENEMDENSKKITKQWPNTYTFTKAMTEDLIRTKCQNMSVGIFRPGIAEEPVPGWVDNYYGPNGMAASVAAGIMKVMHGDPNAITNVVPVDYLVNALIASAWDVATQTDRRGENMLIYNYSSTKDARITCQMMADFVNKSLLKYPPEKRFGRKSKILCVKNKYDYMCKTLYLHWMRACFYDTLAVILGRKPRLIKIYRKLDEFSKEFTYFNTREWQFENHNVTNMWQRLDKRDRQIFKFTMQNFDWNAYFEEYVKGVSCYLLKKKEKNDIKTMV